MKNPFEFLSKLQIFMIKHNFLNFVKYLYYYNDRLLCFFIKKSKKVLNKKQVVIIANLGLGDAMDFLSVANKYRQIYPKSKYELTLITSPGLKKLFESELDYDFIYSKNFNEITTSLKRRVEFIKFINSKKYNILIDIMGPTGCSPSVYLIRSSSATEKITLKNKANCFCPESILRKTYTKVFEIDDNKISNIDYYNKLYNLIKGNGGVYEIEYFKTKRYQINVDLPSKYYIVFPSASAEVKKWPLDRYAKIIKRIYNRTKLPIVFCGTKIDEDSVKKLITLIGNVPYYNILGQTNVLEFIQIIKDSQFVITNDTSAYHIAVIEEIPTAIIVGGYTYDSFVLYNFENNKYKRPYPIVNERKCFNCRSHCPYIKDQNIWPCLDAVSVEYAWKIIEKMLIAEKVVK